MNNIQLAQDGRREKSLNTLMRYEDGVMTRKQWIELQFKNGKKAEETTKNRIDFCRRKFNRMTSYKEQEVYEKKCSERVKCYKISSPDGSFYHITKFEFDYFNTL